MWLKLVTRMRLMLLLLRVLQTERRNTSTKEHRGGCQDAYGQWGRDGYDCRRDHPSAAWVKQLETSGWVSRLEENIIDEKRFLFQEGSLLSSAALLLLTTWSNKAALMKSYCECFITMSLIPTTITQHQLNVVLISERRKQIPNTLLSYT